MGTLHVKEKDIVIPGEELAEGMDYLPVAALFEKEKNHCQSNWHCEC